MNCWKYENGQLQPAELDWPGEGSSWDESLRRLGYCEVLDVNFGSISTGDRSGKPGLGVGVYSDANASPPRYLAHLFIGSELEWVQVPNLPSLLAFLRDLAPIADLALRSREAEDLAEHLASHDAVRVHVDCIHCRRETAAQLSYDRPSAPRRRR